MQAHSQPPLTTAKAGASRGADSRPQTEVGYWQPRLVRRKYIDLAKLTPGNEYSALIEHDGTSFFFPLGTNDEERAAAKALEIDRSVVDRGWKATSTRYSREITVAVFWSNNPVACTYTTLLTAAANLRFPTPVAQPHGRAVNIWLVEADQGVRRTLAYWLNRIAEYHCLTALGNAGQTLRRLQHHSPDLLFFSRALADLPISAFLEQLNHLQPEVPAFGFGVYKESDDVFISLTGVTGGYFFRRRHPLELLDPLQGAWKGHNSSPEQIKHRIRTYFQNLLNDASQANGLLESASLTHREHEILNCLSKGYHDKEIARTLRISGWTVHTHLKNIFEKLGVHTRTEAVLKYLQK